MAWGAPYESPDEQAAKDAERDAHAAAQMRAKMTAFERALLDTLGEIRDVFVSINERDIDSQHETNDADIEERAACMYYASRYDAAGQPDWDYLPQQVGGVRGLFLRMSRATYGIPETSTTAGDGGGASAGPVDRAGPGPARPDSP